MTRRADPDRIRPGLPRAVENAARQAMATSTAPGLAVALVHHGRVVWAAGYGVADQVTRQPVTAATRFQAASLSKPVTAWGVLRLVEQGRIGLDDPVLGHLRRWHPPPSPFDTDAITVRRLLSHTAGLSVHGYAGQQPDRPLAVIEISLSGETGGSFPVELLEAPGGRWLYSGGGYSVLQLLVEELTGRPFADYMQAEVLQPLGMSASSFGWQRTAATAFPHDAAGGRIPDFAFAEQAAAGLVTTAPDLARFLAAALSGPDGEPPGRAVLSPARVRLALTAAPATSGRWGLGYGLGWLAGGDRLAYHEGPTTAGGPAWHCCPTDERAAWCWPTATAAAPRSTPWSSSGWRSPRRAPSTRGFAQWHSASDRGRSRARAHRQPNTPAKTRPTRALARILQQQAEQCRRAQTGAGPPRPRRLPAGHGAARPVTEQTQPLTLVRLLHTTLATQGAVACRKHRWQEGHGRIGRSAGVHLSELAGDSSSQGLARREAGRPGETGVSCMNQLSAPTYHHGLRR